MTWQCDKCGGVNDFAPLSRTDGVFEVHYLKCDGCGAEIISAVSDEALRANIALYRAMASKIAAKRVSERFLRKAQRLKNQNVERSRELRKQYELNQ